MVRVVKRMVLVVGLFVAAMGCTSGIVPVGNGQYMLSRTRYCCQTKAEMAAEVYREAEVYCAQQSKRIQVIEDSSVGVNLATYPEGNIRFTCE
jgi:hypothetical protein